MPVTANADSIAARVKAWAKWFDPQLEQWAFGADADGAVTGHDVGQRRLIESMRYSLLAPGKRLRPYLVCRCCELSGSSRDAAVPIAAAIECVHAFSLIHDDLPAMDDDELRRGRPTNHVKFGEAMAILAGDALLALAFELIARGAPDERRASALTLELARAGGAYGMIGGQAADVDGENAPPSRELAEFIHGRKTARLFESACRLGALVAGTDDSCLEALATYGQALGRAFQIADDLLDVTANAESMGKSVGKDAEAGKQSFPRCVGIEESRRYAAEELSRAISSVQRFGDQADDLRDLARFALERQN